MATSHVIDAHIIELRMPLEKTGSIQGIGNAIAGINGGNMDIEITNMPNAIRITDGGMAIYEGDVNGIEPFLNEHVAKGKERFRIGKRYGKVECAFLMHGGEHDS